MDFETINPALPRWPGTRPYEHVPFQFSIHVQPRSGGRTVHHEFLANGDGDPRPDLLRALLAVFDRYRAKEEFRNGLGDVVVYNKTMEANVLKRLAAWYPKHARALGAIEGRLWDLLVVIRNHVYHPKFYGTYSLKAVLPALTHMDYDELPIADGQAAALAFDQLNRGALNREDASALRGQLLDYCRIDTLGMHALLAALRRGGATRRNANRSDDGKAPKSSSSSPAPFHSCP